MQRKERNLPRPALSRAGARRAAEPISKMRPDAEEILRLVLARLDDIEGAQPRAATGIGRTLAIALGQFALGTLL